MGLGEFLRQWQGSRMAGGVALSVLLHLLVIAALLWGPPPFPKAMVKRGEPLFVELPPAAESPPPGTPGAPRPAARPAAPPGPKPQPALPSRTIVAARPPAPRAEAPRAPAPPTPVTPPTPVAPQHRAEPAPAPKAPDGETPSPPAVAAPPEPAPTPPSMAESVQPAPPAPPAPQVLAAVPPAPPARPVPDIRSLRRGTGGAGGSGEGRAGIEGEPIPLDSADPRYSDYLDQIRRRIKDKWGYPCVKNDHTRECEYKTAQLVIEFGIAKDGKVPFINIVRSSGYPIYDDYAVNAVKLAEFPPIPDSFSKKGVPILATFSYVVQSSLTNILR